MARYKHIDTSPRFLAVDLQRQLLPGTFEHAMNHLIDHELDLSGFDARFCNDATGAAAYPPAMLLKVVLFAYSQSIVSSRNIERACREHVTFIRRPQGRSLIHFAVAEKNRAPSPRNYSFKSSSSFFLPLRTTPLPLRTSPASWHADRCS